ncbi:hypothetical protein RRG08_031261 [Elysia crispata]|uniref:Uncharacterized protein n=1 Tax=Elysia crispata TaxID=231223 RepID=A0AAE1AJH0_9GAST|nr:hypothetical protein RRG08_031261 [Elysia crispata]
MWTTPTMVRWMYLLFLYACFVVLTMIIAVESSSQLARSLVENELGPQLQVLRSLLSLVSLREVKRLPRACHKELATLCSAKDFSLAFCGRDKCSL